MHTKQFLFLLLLMMGISSSMSYGSSDYTKLSEKQWNQELKTINKHLDDIQKEINHHEAGILMTTTSHIGLAIMVLSMASMKGITSLENGDGRPDNTSLVPLLCAMEGIITGLFTVLLSHMRCRSVSPELLTHYEMMVKEKNKILNLLEAKKEDPAI